MGFRIEVKELAEKLGLTGWVKNFEKDVHAEIQGEKDKIIFLIEFMKSLIRANVKSVKLNELNVKENETDFIIVRE